LFSLCSFRLMNFNGPKLVSVCDVRVEFPLSKYTFGYKPSVTYDVCRAQQQTAFWQMFATLSERAKSATSIARCKVKARSYHLPELDERKGGRARRAKSIPQCYGCLLLQGMCRVSWGRAGKGSQPFTPSFLRVDRFKRLLAPSRSGDISDRGMESGSIVEALDEGEDVAWASARVWCW
jgi:hypothetical protein